MKNRTRILLTAGGTGGHFFPALAIATELKKENFDVHFSTDKRCMKYTSKDSEINFKIIDLYIRTGSIAALMLLPIKITIACVKALLYVSYLRPKAVIGFGGYPSFPTLFACKILSIPIILHEQNRFLGKVNRFFAKSAKLVAFSYDQHNNDINNELLSKNQQINSEYIGDIVRDQIKKIKISNSFTNDPIRIFIFGGSQGAKIFTEAIPAAIKIAKSINPDFNCFITHQVSSAHQKYVSNQYESMGIKHQIQEFFHDIEKIYKKTDLVISRSGASTIAELSAIGLPAILVPLAISAENHQLENAKFIENIGGGWVLEEHDSLEAKLASLMIKIDNNRKELIQAATNISSRKSDGTKALVATVKRIVNK